jgi:hypothetical protein
MRRPGTRLVRMHGWRGGYYVVPGGGRVDDQAALQVIAHPYVRGGKDGLFPSHDQTWHFEPTPISATNAESAVSTAIPHD